MLLTHDASYFSLSKMQIFSPWKFTLILLRPRQPVDLFCYCSMTTSTDQEALQFFQSFPKERVIQTLL